MVVECFNSSDSSRRHFTMQGIIQIFRPFPKNASPLLDPSHNRSDVKQLLQKGKGFTLIEILIVIMIIGILAGVAVGIYLNFQGKAYIKAIESDLANAYKISAAIYVNNPDEEIDMTTLLAKGFVESKGVDILVVDGNLDTLSMTGTHPNVLGIYELDNTGRIFKQ
jgi:prepilin-type N-terminal cleavage/methylation domain-containing protein